MFTVSGPNAKLKTATTEKENRHRNPLERPASGGNIIIVTILRMSGGGRSGCAAEKVATYNREGRMLPFHLQTSAGLENGQLFKIDSENK